MIEFTDNDILHIKQKFDNVAVYGTAVHEAVIYITNHIPFLTVKEVVEMTTKFLKDCYGDNVNDYVENWEYIPGSKDRYGKKWWNKPYIEWSTHESSQPRTLQDLYNKVPKDEFAFLFYLLKIRDEDPSKLKKMFESDTEGKYLPYSVLFKYLPHRKFELPKYIESEKPKKKSVDKKKMISDIGSMLSEHKKSKKHQMIKDIDDLLVSINTSKPKTRKSVDSSIKANKLIHDIEGKIKKRKTARKAIDKFF